MSNMKRFNGVVFALWLVCGTLTAAAADGPSFEQTARYILEIVKAFRATYVMTVVQHTQGGEVRAGRVVEDRGDRHADALAPLNETVTHPVTGARDALREADHVLVAVGLVQVLRSADGGDARSGVGGGELLREEALLRHTGAVHGHDALLLVQRLVHAALDERRGADHGDDVLVVDELRSGLGRDVGRPLVVLEHELHGTAVPRRRGGPLLAEGIGDNVNAVTRFVLVSRTVPPP